MDTTTVGCTTDQAAAKRRQQTLAVTPSWLTFFCPILINKARSITMSVILAIWIFMVILGLTSVAALVWAIHAGQFQSLEDGAESIFDADEPIGMVTDSFPVSPIKQKVVNQ